MSLSGKVSSQVRINKNYIVKNIYCVILTESIFSMGK